MEWPLEDPWWQKGALGLLVAPAAILLAVRASQLFFWDQICMPHNYYRRGPLYLRDGGEGPGPLQLTLSDRAPCLSGSSHLTAELQRPVALARAPRVSAAAERGLEFLLGPSRTAEISAHSMLQIPVTATERGQPLSEHKHSPEATFTPTVVGLRPRVLQEQDMPPFMRLWIS